jgi:hypothetical protein
LNRDLHGLALGYDSSKEASSVLRTLIQRHQKDDLFDRHMTIEPDPRCTHHHYQKRPNASTTSLLSNFLAHCQHSAQLAAVFGFLLLFRFPNLSHISVCLFCFSVLFLFPYYTSLLLLRRNIHARLDKAGQQNHQNARRAQNTPVLHLVWSILTFFSFFDCVLLSFLGPRGLSSFFPVFPTSCARYSGWIPKTCNYAQLHPSNLRRIARFFLIAIYCAESVSYVYPHHSATMCISKQQPCTHT